MALQHLHSSTANKRPTPGAMSVGQLAINLNTASPGLFFKDSAGALIKVGPVHVGTTAPNASPAGGGETGNTVGEQWLDIAGGTYVFKVWDGSAWRSESGTFVDVNGDVMTGALGIIAGSAGSPGLYFSGDTNTGLYSPGADQVAISTNGTGRLFVDASGRVGLGVTTPGTTLDLGSGTIRIRNAPGDSNGLQFYQDISDISRIYNFYPGPIAFGTNNTERMRITSAGALGLGTSAPPALFSAHSTDTSANFFIGEFQSIANPTGLSNTYVKFEKGDGFGGAVGGFIEQGVGSGLKLAALNGGTLTDVVTIRHTGNVGIGTTSPVFGVGDGLEVARSGVSTIRVSSNSQGVELRSDAGTGTLETRGAFPLLFGIQGTERARIDSSGRLLVGTSSARSNLYNSTVTSPLQVEGTTDNNNSVLITMNAAGAAGPRLDFAKSRGSSVGSNTVAVADDTLGTVSFQGSDGTEFVAGAYIQAQVDGTPGANDMPGRLVFSTTADGASSPTERMRIGSNGYVQFSETGTYSPDATSGWHKFYQSANQRCIQTYSTSSTFTNYSLIQYIAAGGGTGSGFASGYSDNGSIQRYIIFSNGNIQNTNNSYAGISDLKLKENITDANSQWLDIKLLQVRNYNLKHSPDHRQIGVIAQEIEQISPGLVYETPDRDAEGNDLGTVTKSVNYSVLYMKAVKALQEAMERIETLEAKVAALEGV